MYLGDFLKEAIKRNINISNKAEFDWNWYNYEKYAGLTSLVDFECNFDKDGMCKKYKPNERHSLSKRDVAVRSMCCCDGCGSAVGHLRCLPNSINTLKNIADLFDKRTGFWRLNKGCVLQREYRSTTCLFYRCDINGKSHPAFFLLERMMQTWWVRDKYHSRMPPKKFDIHNGKHDWVAFEQLEKMLKKELRENNRKRKPRKIIKKDT